MAKSKLEEARASSLHQSDANPAPPMPGIHIERKQLPMIRQIGIAGWRGRRKAKNSSFFFGYDGSRFLPVRFLPIKGGKVIPAGSVFGTKLIEVVIGKKSTIGRLP